MGHALDILVEDATGNPFQNKRVKVHLEGFWKGGDMEKHTDLDGHAKFETTDNYESSRKLWITVADRRFGPYEIGGGAYTVNLGK